MSKLDKRTRGDFNNLCETCHHQDCCTNSVVPLVFSHDLETLKKIGVGDERFIKEIKIGNKNVKTIRKKDGSNECILWDSERKMCSIYEDRPFDCKVYPFDILKVGKKYHWIVYSCNPDSDWTWSEKYLRFLESDVQFNEVMDEISTYHEYTKTLMGVQNEKQIPYKILREVRQDQ